MMGLLKTVGKGLLYIIGLPFFLLVLAAYAIFGLFLLIFMFFKSIVFFFTGRSLDDELPEDKMARERKEGKSPSTTPVETVQEQPVSQPYTSSNETTTYQGNIESAIFGPYVAPTPAPAPVPVTEEPEPEPEPVEEPVQEETIFEQPVFNQPIEEPVSQINIDEINTPKNTNEHIEQYVPHTDNSRFIDEEEEEEEDSGVTITFGDDDE